MVDEIVFQGIKFRRYPDSDRRDLRMYYKPGITDRRDGVKDLHVEIWMAAHGDVPEGHHIHHIDEDSTNNDLENLECIPGPEHLSGHNKGAARLTSEKHLAHLAEIRPLTKKWHGSKEGRKWHVEHAKEGWKDRQPELRVCAQCGEGFYTHDVGRPTRFCSNACKSAWRRDSGIDDEVRICVVCASVFEVNRYIKKDTCSRSCTAKLRWKNRKSGS